MCRRLVPTRALLLLLLLLLAAALAAASPPTGSVDALGEADFPAHNDDEVYIVTYSDRVRPGFCHFLRSVERYNVSRVHVIGFTGQKVRRPWRRRVELALAFVELLQDKNPFVLFTHRHLFERGVLFSGELHVWPWDMRKVYERHKDTTPGGTFPRLNAGGYVGRAHAVRALLTAALARGDALVPPDAPGFDDQRTFGWLYTTGEHPDIAVDLESNIFLALHGVREIQWLESERQLRAGQVKNVPWSLHFNGAAKWSKTTGLQASAERLELILTDPNDATYFENVSWLDGDLQPVADDSVPTRGQCANAKVNS